MWIAWIKTIYTKWVGIIEPMDWPDKPPEKILMDHGWSNEEIKTFLGQFQCMYIAAGQCKRAIWECMAGRNK